MSAGEKTIRSRIAALEARIARLEALLAALLRQPCGTATTLPLALGKRVLLDARTPFGPKFRDPHEIGAKADAGAAALARKGSSRK